MSSIINHLISEKIHSMSGACSTFLPGVDSSLGNRGPMTFLGSTDYTDPDHFMGTKSITFFLPADDHDNCRIRNTYGNLDPLPFDYIIYAKDRHTYLMYIVSVNEKAQTYWDVTTELIDRWDTYDEISEGNVDVIDVTVGCISRLISRDFMSYGIATDIIVDQDDLNVTGIVDNVKTININYGFRFNVTSRNSNNLGNFRIQLEFNTNQQSPAMDTIIAQKFTDIYPNILNNVVEEKMPRIDPYVFNNEKLTFRGYMGNYSCCATPEKGSYNFDSEKLDNFTVIIKDFNDGLKDRNFSRDVCIPKSILENARSSGNPYVCKIYGYVNTHDDIYHKVYIGDITTDLYNIIDSIGDDDSGEIVIP